MASKMQTSSFLPTIKCSDCSAEIQISMMGEHTCSNVGQRAPPPGPSYQTRTVTSPLPSNTGANKPAAARGGRMAPPRIDPSAANRPFLEPGPLTPSSMSSVSPTMSSYSHKSSRRVPARSATAPLPRGPPSPELSNLDCAFPPFPIPKSRSATPTRELESKQSRSNYNEYVRMHAEASPMFAPLSPRGNGGGKVLQRINTIAPGPFDLGSRDRRAESQGYDEKQHKRTGTVTSGKDFPMPPSSESTRHIPPRPSTASSVRSRKPSLASIAGGPRSMLDRDRPNLAPESAMLISDQPKAGAENGSNRDHLQESAPNPPLMPEKRSQTFPISNQHKGISHQHTGPPPQRPSEPSPAPRNRRPTVSATSDFPLPAITTSYDVPFNFTSTTSSSLSRGGATVAPPQSQSRGEHKSDTPLNVAPPIRVPHRTKDFGTGTAYHTPTDSFSSSGSYGSDARSGSSRSSPPLSDASTRPRTKPLNIDQVGDAKTVLQKSTDRSQSKESKGLKSANPTRSVDKSMLLRPMEASPQRDTKTSPPESPMDPAIQRGRLSPFPPPSSHLPSPGSVKQPTLAPPPTRRPTAGNKGNCRGCGELIQGKSVSSADGRLTGRYHKQCFVCKTCRKPFETADFYVINNHPYCERHYHQLNNSLCRSCDRGIEGQYLATESKQKFHPHCFTCQDCRIILKDDYFEMNDKVYCERHAFRAAQQSTFLGPGRRNPERRTTRLMMM